MLFAYPTPSEYQTQTIPGIVMQTGLFQLFGLRGPEWDDYPEFCNPTDDEIYRGSYGVCDGVDNLLEVYPELLQPERTFTVSMTPIHKSQEPDDGGWRWHKWGDYIGKQDPQCEYIYHEPVIETVYCFHLYEKLPVTA